MAPREIRELYIPPALLDKLFGKSIWPEEVREAVTNAPNVRRGPKNSPGQVGRCYFIEGPTNAGRILKVLVRRFDNGLALVITAWQSERHP